MHKTSWLITGALIVMTASVAHAGLQTNGVQVNGVQVNGVQVNGVQVNGVQVNGVQVNGVQVNGVQVNGVQVNGTNLSASFIGSLTNNTCSHREDVTGIALPGSCSPCAQIVTSADAFCATTSWDSLCVNRAKTSCKLTSSQLVGQSIRVTMKDSSWAMARITTVTAGSSNTNHDGDTRTPNLNMSDVLYHTLTWACPHAATQTGAAMPATCSSTAQAVCALDSFCCTTSWDSACVAEATSVTGANKTAKHVAGPVCGNTRDTNGDGIGDAAGRGIFLAGAWSTASGYDGAGGRTSSSATSLMFGCEDTGAIAKCVNQGYKPWVSTALSDLHEGCVRMIRGDFCGDGVSWTANGEQIDVGDYVPYQQKQQECPCVFEATWNKRGASYMTDYRARYLDSGNSISFLDYRAARPYCAARVTFTSNNYVPPPNSTTNQLTTNWYSRF